MKKTLVLVALVMAALMVFTACSGGGAPATSSSSAAASAGESAAVSAATSEAATTGSITIAMLPKFKGENYFDACKTGAEEAVKELKDAGKDVTLIYDGPPQDNATNQKQVDILEGWIAQKVNVILVSANDPTAIAPTLEKAMKAGIKVITFDADADSRDLFVNQASADGIAEGMVKAVADSLSSKGYGKDNTANVALVSSAKTDANQNAWIASIKKLLATDDYSWLKIQNEDTDIYYPGPDETECNKQCGTLIARMGEGSDKIQAAIGLSSMATPALGAQYAQAASKPDASKITMTGLATPNALKDYIKDATNPLDTGVLWSCMDLGYLSVETGYQMATGVITSDSTSMTTERLGERTITDKTILLGDALIFNKDNVDQFNY